MSVVFVTDQAQFRGARLAGIAASLIVCGRTGERERDKAKQTAKKKRNTRQCELRACVVKGGLLGFCR